VDTYLTHAEHSVFNILVLGDGLEFGGEKHRGWSDDAINEDT